ncbi:MAG: YjjG family noncanonical pyrimidine nucleotidase [Acetatifactor sp.]
MRRKGEQGFTTILWDVDGTLLDFDYSMRASLRKCFHTLGRTLTEDMVLRYSQINDGYWKRLERGEITKAQLLTGRFRDFFREYEITGVDETSFLREFQTGLGNNYAFEADALNTVKALQGHYRQYAVTNGVEATQRNKLNLSGLSEVMDGVFISEVIGCAKPGKDFFDYCLGQIGEKDKSRILIVGDSMTSDILGGIRAGIRTCWYNPGERSHGFAYSADYEISVLPQIYEVLGIWDPVSVDPDPVTGD